MISDEGIRCAARSMQLAADKNNIAADRIEEALRQMQMLFDPGYGGIASLLLEKLNSIKIPESNTTHADNAVAPPGIEEGDTCNRNGCHGIMGYEPVHNCSCHINPPCSACTNNPLVCLECGES